MTDFEALSKTDIEVLTEGKKIHDMKPQEVIGDLYPYHRYKGESIYSIEMMVQDSDGDIVGRVEVLNKGERLHIFHMRVKTTMRGMGIGTTLVKMMKSYIRNAPYEKLSGRIGNHGTKEFLIENGFNPEYLHKGEVPVESIEAVSVTDFRSFREHGHKHYNEIEDDYEGAPISEAIQQW